MTSRKTFVALPFVLFVGALAWGAAVSPAVAAGRCVFPVQAFNDPARSAAGDLSPLVRFSDVELTPRAVGYGAAGGRSDEITIADGRLYLVRPGGAGGASMRRTPAAGEGALMLQVAPVRAWEPARTVDAPASLDELGRALDEAVAQAGCHGPTRLAFRVEGRAASASWSLDTLPEKAELASLDTPVVVVGLYTTIDPARHAMPAGRRFHAHAVFPASGEAGHLRAIVFDGPVRLQLQAR